MKVSVVITAFNIENFIKDAIDSVLCQTRQPDEILIIDDCSTDTTTAKILSYGNAIRYLGLPKNSGGLTATFTGLKNATGDIVFFLDGDDVWSHDKLETIIPVFERNEEMAIVSHNYIRVDENRKNLHVIDDTHQNINRILSSAPDEMGLSEALKDSILAKKGFWCGSAYSLRKRFVDIEKFEQWMSGFSNVRFTYLDLVLPTFILINNPDAMVGYIHKVLFEYRIHSNNTSGNKIPTVDAAKKALRMGHFTMIATCQMFDNLPAYQKYADRQNLMIREYEYLNDIYDNKKTASIKKFIYLSKHHWQNRSIVKEAKRLLLSVVFGPSFFLKLRAKIDRL